jgi:hypothetical protein
VTDDDDDEDYDDVEKDSVLTEGDTLDYYTE